MARQREFDIDQALHQICGVFWHKGYRQTSIQDLVDATGLQRGSLYAAFGNKSALFRRALTHYSDALERRAKDLSDPERLLRTWFREMLSRSGKTEPARGCLMLNSVSELQHLEADDRQEVLAHLQRLEDVFCYCLVGIHLKNGQVFSADVARDQAKSLTVTLIGLCVLSRAGMPLDSLIAMADQTLNGILPQSSAAAATQ